MINLFQPATGKAELEYIERVLRSNWLGKGKVVEAFEHSWAQHVGVSSELVVSTNSCTSALFEAVRLAGIGPGDEVIIPAIHFVSAAQAVLAAGAIPVFCDVDRWTLNATRPGVERRLGRNTKAVILNHYGGLLCDFPRTGLGDLIWIDDLANAPAATVGELGICDYATWSFDAMKIMTTGDGGMLYCRDPEKAHQARQNFALGLDNLSGYNNPNPNWWTVNVSQKGSGRHLMNDIQAAMGLVQLEKLSGFLERRGQLIQIYEEQFAETTEIAVNREEWSKMPYYLYWIYAEKRDVLARYLRSVGIYTSFRYWPLHWAYGYNYHLPESEWAARRVLNLPLHNGLTKVDVEYVCRMIKDFSGNGNDLAKQT